MNRFERRQEPENLKAVRAAFETLNLDALQQWNRFRQRQVYHEIRALLLCISNHTCAFCAGGFAQSRKTIEHFFPKSGPYAKREKVLQWCNLFPACDACQSAKHERSADGLLKPDHPNYQASKFFWINTDDGSLEPLPTAATKDQAMTRATLDVYSLQRPALKKARRSALRQYLKGEPLEDYAFIQQLLS